MLWRGNLLLLVPLLLNGYSIAAAAPFACEVSDWGDCSACACSGSSGQAVQLCTRTILSQHCDSPPKLFKERECSQRCQIDCQVDWKCGVCSASCDSGQQVCLGEVTAYPKNNGRPCPPLQDLRACTIQPCPIADCFVGNWTSCSPCSTTCGGTGKMLCERIVLRPRIGTGKQCPTLRKLLPCPVAAECPSVDCALSDWSDWGQCSSSCGAQIAHSRTMSRSRKVTKQQTHGGKACPAVLTMTKDCTPLPCPEDCQLGDWREWSQCDRTCGDRGKRTRTRAIANHAAFGGKACGQRQASILCIKPPCPEDCQYTLAQCTVCVLSIGKCAQNCKRTLVSTAEFGGVPCEKPEDGDVITVTECGEDPSIRSCYTPSPTPVFRGCIVSEFNDWSPCSGSCGGGGTQFRNRKILRAAPGALSAVGTTSASSTKIGGKEPSIATTHFTRCPPLQQTRNCSFDDTGLAAVLRAPWWRQESCPQDCEVTAWNCGHCSQTCGDLRNATETCVRQVLRPSKAGGRLCPALLQNRVCTSGTAANSSRHTFLPCPQDCLVSPFTVKYGTHCTRSCGWGQVVRTRRVIRPNAYGGKRCPRLEEVKLCNTRHCPGVGDCLVTKWDQKR
jgi:hypothetical protein